MKRACVVLALMVCVQSADAARWKQGAENVIDVRQWGTSGVVAVGEGDRSWFHGNAWGVSFRPADVMADSENSGDLSVSKTAGGECFFDVVLKFTKPISEFRFTTPKMSSLDLSSGDVVLTYTTSGGGPAKELWRMSATSPGYAKGGGVEPKQLDWVKLAKPVDTLTLRFALVGFVGDVSFRSAADDGGVLEYRVPILPMHEMTQITLVPDGAASCNVSTTDEALRAFIDVGPTLPAELPKVVAVDLGREKIVPVLCEPFASGYIAELSTLPAGAYQLRVTLKDGERSVSVNGPKITRVHPPRLLTWRQTQKSPFGIVGIIHVPEMAKRTGIHANRGGSNTWCVGNPAKGVYCIDENGQATILGDMAGGIVRRYSLAFSPTWAVDPARVKAGEWPGHHAPRKECLADYAEFCRRTAESTKGWYVPEFEIWNEPNGMPFGSFKGTFDEFVAICHTAADAILAVNPDARMILGTTGDVDLAMIERLLRAGLSKKYRLIDVHPYRHSDQGPEDGLLSDINRLKDVIRKYGDNQGIIFSEVGWPTNPCYKGGHGGYEPVSRQQQAHFFSRTMLISLAAGVECVQFHILRDWASGPKDPEANFGVVDIENQAKPSVAALATTARHLELTKFLGMASNVAPYHYAWYWQTPWVKDATLVTIWCDRGMVPKGKVQWVALPGEPIAAEDLWGERPDTSRLRKKGDRWEVLPGEDPIFVYVPTSTVPADLKPLPKALRPWHLQKYWSSAVKNEMTIDGDLSEWGDLPGEITLGRSTGAATMAFAGIGDASRVKATQKTSRFDVRYDEKGMAVAVDVCSDAPPKNDAEGWWIWTGDCVRLYVGTVAGPEQSHMSEKHVQFALAPVTKGNGPAQAVNLGYLTASGVESGALIPGAKVASKTVTGGWTMELFVPWSFFGKVPTTGEVWGFDIEAGGSVWNGRQDNWTNPLRWGELVFGTQPTTTAATP